MGKAIVISSVSGGGKNTIVSNLTERNPSLSVCITATSRSPRPGEKHGKDYLFFSTEDFKEGIEKDEFLEYAEVHGNYYGVPEKEVLAAIEEGRSVILIIDIQGMRSVKSRLKEKALSVFLMPPDHEEWERRLRGRGTESEEQIVKRLERGKIEIAAAHEYDFVVVNDSVEECTARLEKILKEQKAL